MYLTVILLGIIVLAKIIEGLGEKMHVSNIVSTILLGIAISIVLRNYDIPENIGSKLNFLAKIGVVLLMFLAGLEIDVRTFKKYFSSSIIIAILGVVFPLISFFWLGMVLNLGLIQSAYLGLIFSATSVAVVVEYLKGKNQLNSKIGATVLSIAIVDDILVILLSSVLLQFIEPGNIAYELLKLSLGLVIFVGLIYLINKYLSKHIFKLFNDMRMPDFDLSFALLLCSILTVLSLVLGLSSILGAFLTGLLLSKYKGKNKIIRGVETLGNLLFFPLFFLSIGMRFQIEGIVENLGLLLVLVVLGVITKLFAGYIGGNMARFNRRESLFIGSGLVSRGEMAFIILSICLSQAVFEGTFISVVIASVVIVTLISSILLQRIDY